MTQRLKNRVFLGNANCNCSNSQVWHLFTLLYEAIGAVSAAQQGSPDDGTALGVEQYAKEIYLGLTGDHVVRTKPAKPEPPNEDEEELIEEEMDDDEDDIRRGYVIEVQSDGHAMYYGGTINQGYLGRHNGWPVLADIPGRAEVFRQRETAVEMIPDLERHFRKQGPGRFQTGGEDAEFSVKEVVSEWRQGAGGFGPWQLLPLRKKKLKTREVVINPPKKTLKRRGK